MEIVLAIGLLSYVSLNLYVGRKIRVARYGSEDRRQLHQRFIWLLPFLGPLLIKSYWQSAKAQPEVITRGQRKTNSSGSNTDNWQQLTGWGQTMR